jgi:hypothetical protein
MLPKKTPQWLPYVASVTLVLLISILSFRLGVKYGTYRFYRHAIAMIERDATSDRLHAPVDLPMLWRDTEFGWKGEVFAVESGSLHIRLGSGDEQVLIVSAQTNVQRPGIANADMRHVQKGDIVLGIGEQIPSGEIATTFVKVLGHRLPTTK